jgi:polyisoprenoid-binding protein YceI
MKPALAFATVMALVVTPAAAQKPPAPLPPVLGPEGVVAGTYVIDTKETLVRYATLHMGLNEFWGTFPGATGTLTIDPKDVSKAKLDVTAPISSV